jgi:endonuclease YncB( thermonuclease family)
MLRLNFVAVVVLLAGQAFALEGVAPVVDGDTIEIHGQRIRLFAIDTPEKGQPCWNASGAEYHCGQQAFSS